MTTCLIPDCSKQSARRGWCHMHYARWRSHGDPLLLLPKPTLEEAFWGKVEKADGCWEWRGARSSAGYGNFRSRVAHRIAYELSVGPVPDGLDLDHLCRNRGCVNPAHLEPVTRRENSLRGQSPTILKYLAGECGKGHKIEGDNAAPAGDRYRCRACARVHTERTTRRRRAERGVA